MENLNFDSLAEFAPKNSARKTFNWSLVYANEKQVCKVLNVQNCEDNKQIRKEIRDNKKLDNFISNLPTNPPAEQKKVIKQFFALICSHPAEITFLKQSNIEKITKILEK
jgi:hypothetical protein